MFTKLALICTLAFAGLATLIAASPVPAATDGAADPQTTRADPKKLLLFKGLFDDAANGVLTAPVPGGLHSGAYRPASDNSAGNFEYLVPREPKSGLGGLGRIHSSFGLRPQRPPAPPRPRPTTSAPASPSLPSSASTPAAVGSATHTPGLQGPFGGLLDLGGLGGSFTGSGWIRKRSGEEPTETQGSEPGPTDTHGIEPEPTSTSGSEPKPTETHSDEPEPTTTHGSEPEMPSESGSPTPGRGQPGGISHCNTGTITCCNSVQADGSMGDHGSYDIPFLGGVVGGGSASGSLAFQCDGVNSSSRAV